MLDEIELKRKIWQEKKENCEIVSVVEFYGQEMTDEEENLDFLIAENIALYKSIMQIKEENRIDRIRAYNLQMKKEAEERIQRIREENLRQKYGDNWKGKVEQIKLKKELNAINPLIEIRVR